MAVKNDSIIIKFEGRNEQTVGDITKIVGLIKARYFISIIDSLEMDANPRSSKTGAVTDAIQETIENVPALFPFMTKGVLLAASCYEYLERGRIKITPDNPQIEGILDGGHNTLAIGLYLLKQALDYYGIHLPRGAKTWDEFKQLWNQNRNMISNYMDEIKKSGDFEPLNFLVPVELLVPRKMDDAGCVSAFKNNLLEICEARNNNVELQLPAKANQKGYFDELKELMEAHNKNIAKRMEWKTNDGGDIKAQDMIALVWIPLNLIAADDDNKQVRKAETVSPNKLYSGKGSCMKQFEKLMSSPHVTGESNDGYRRELQHSGVKSAFQAAIELPELYDYIFEMFPKYYNASGRRFMQITAVKKLNEKRKEKTAPFSGRQIEILSPEGFIVPLVYGLQALMVKKEVNGETTVAWSQPPMPFLERNLEKIIAEYAGILSICDYDPQKVGKALQSYSQALNIFKMAAAGIL